MQKLSNYFVKTYVFITKSGKVTLIYNTISTLLYKFILQTICFSLIDRNSVLITLFFFVFSFFIIPFIANFALANSEGVKNFAGVPHFLVSAENIPINLNQVMLA